MAKQRILVVDDEEIVTTTLKTLFELETNYGVRTGNNPVAALAELKKRPVDLIIADFVMPEMNGIDFLREAHDLYPEVPLILLTGYADKESAIQAINEIGLYQYLEKPWDNRELLLVVKNGLEKRSLLTQLQRKVEELRVSNEKLKEAYDEVVRTQEELLRADRMATIGRVSERVAGEMLMHMPALSLVQEIIDRYPEDEFLQQTAGAVQQAARCVIGVAEDIKGFAQRGTPNYEKKRQVLSRVVWNTINFLGFEADMSFIRISTNFLAEPVFAFNEDKIEQLMVNLVRYAARSCNGRGEITITLNVQGNDALLQVEDSGRGMGAEALENLWEPFAESEEDEEGAGLGFDICRRIVEGHNGRIECESEPGSGTIFRVLLPMGG